MHIAPARLEDARQVAEIHVTTWQSAYQGIVPAEYLASLSVDQREAMWRESIAEGVPELLVAKAEGGMVGWVAFGPCRDEGSPADSAEVWAIYVAPVFLVERGRAHALAPRAGAHARTGVQDRQRVGVHAECPRNQVLSCRRVRA